MKSRGNQSTLITPIFREKHDNLPQNISSGYSDSNIKIFKYMDQPVFIFKDDLMLFANQAAIHFIKAENMPEKTDIKLSEILSFDEFQKISDTHRAILQNNSSTGRMKNRVTRFDGSEVDVESLSFYFQFNNKPAILLLFKEIDRFSKNNSSIKSSKNIYRSIFEVVGMAMILIEENSILSLVNSEFLKLTGYSRDDVEGKKSWHYIVAQEDLARMKQYHIKRRQNSNSPPMNYGFRLKCANGEYKNVYLTISMIPGTMQSVASIVDITDVKRTERALIESEERYRMLAENARDIIMVYDMKGKILYVNKAGCDITGLVKDKIQGRDIWKLFPNYKGKNIIKEVLERKVGDDAVCFHKTNFKKKTGDNIQFEICSTVIALEDDRRSILFIARDITERKRLEKETHDMFEKVRQQVGQDLHDDLGPHLIGIEALTAVLKHKMEQKASPEVADLEKIRMLINRAIMKTHMLMRGLCPVDLDSKGLIAAFTNLTSLIVTIFKVECRFEYDQSITVKDNTLATNLYYIAKEAVHNACRHSGARLIFITLRYKNNNFIVEVADDGKGITASARKKPGMGMRILRYRADLINGSIELHKNKPRGTVVICTVPDIQDQKEEYNETGKSV